jgi:hypothetical protein
MAAAPGRRCVSGHEEPLRYTTSLFFSHGRRRLGAPAALKRDGARRVTQPLRGAPWPARSTPTAKQRDDPMPSTEFVFARVFLLTAASLFLVGYALPLLFAPLAWARHLRWSIPDRTELTVYFGRCLGGVATAIVTMCFVAAVHPEKHVVLFDVIALAGAIMTGVHVWGWWRRAQPWTETLEIPLYAALAGIAIAARPVI